MPLMQQRGAPRRVYAEYYSAGTRPYVNNACSALLEHKQYKLADPLDHSRLHCLAAHRVGSLAAFVLALHQLTL